MLSKTMYFGQAMWQFGPAGGDLHSAPRPEWANRRTDTFMTRPRASMGARRSANQGQPPSASYQPTWACSA
jgi:hypothetical protein